MTALAAVGIVVAAVGLCGRWLFERKSAGLAIALLAATMPLVVRNPDEVWRAIGPLLAVPAWLAAVAAFERSGHVTWLAWSGVALGAAMPWSGSAAVMMPLLLAATVITLAAVDPPHPFRPSVFAAPVIGFLVTAIPFAIYVAINPSWYYDRVTAYGLYDTVRFNPLQGAREVMSWVGLTERSASYWHYFDPALLFLSGRTFGEALTAPRVFLLPFLVLLPLGMAGVWSQIPRRTAVLLVAAFVLAPVGGALIARPPSPSRLILLGPPAAMLAYGGWLQLRGTSRMQRIAATGLALALGVHAVVFMIALVGR